MENRIAAIKSAVYEAERSMLLSRSSSTSWLWRAYHLVCSWLQIRTALGETEKLLLEQAGARDLLLHEIGVSLIDKDGASGSIAALDGFKKTIETLQNRLTEASTSADTVAAEHRSLRVQQREREETNKRKTLELKTRIRATEMELLKVLDEAPDSAERHEAIGESLATQRAELDTFEAHVRAVQDKDRAALTEKEARLSTERERVKSIRNRMSSVYRDLARVSLRDDENHPATSQSQEVRRISEKISVIRALHDKAIKVSAHLGFRPHLLLGATILLMTLISFSLIR